MRKPLSLALALVYFLTHAALAHGPEAAFWAERRRALPRPSAQPFLTAAASVGESRPLPARHPLSPSLDALLSTLATAPGSVRAVSGPARPEKIVLLLQDVHGNPDAQANLAKTLAAVFADRRVGLAALEGAAGPVDFEVFRSYPQRDLVKATADFALGAGRLTGPVHAGLTAPVAPPFIGAEDPSLYDANVAAYRRAAPVISPVQSALAARRMRLAADKTSISPALAALDETVEGYHAGTRPFPDYVRAVTSAALVAVPGMDNGAAAQSSQSATPAAPEVRRFLEALALEEMLDEARAEKERDALLALAADRLPEEEFARLARAGVAHRLGRAPPGAFYADLRAACARQGISLSDYPAAKFYFDYAALADGLDGGRLFDELRALEARAYDVLARGPAEKRWARDARSLRLAARLTDFALTPGDWEDYRALAPADPSLAPFEDFYRIARSRDAALARNLLRAMDERKAGAAALVAGGFHAAGLRSALEREGAAVVSFTPRVDTSDGPSGAAYLSAFSREKTPLEKLFQGDKLFLPQRPWTAAIQAERAFEILALESAAAPQADVDVSARRFFGPGASARVRQASARSVDIVLTSGKKTARWRVRLGPGASVVASGPVPLPAARRPYVFGGVALAAFALSLVLVTPEWASVAAAVNDLLRAFGWEGQTVLNALINGASLTPGWGAGRRDEEEEIAGVTPESGTASRKDPWEIFWEGKNNNSFGMEYPASLTRFWEEFFGDLARRHPGARVLDIGTGNGVVPSLALRADPRFEVHGVDRAHAPDFPDGATFHRGDMAQLDPALGRFHAVTSSYGAEYADDFDAVLRAARGALLPGGRAAFLIHSAGSAIVRSARTTRAVFDRMEREDGVGRLRRAVEDADAARADAEIHHLRDVLWQIGRDAEDPFLPSAFQDLARRVMEMKRRDGPAKARELLEESLTRADASRARNEALIAAAERVGSWPPALLLRFTAAGFKIFRLENAHHEGAYFGWRVILEALPETGSPPAPRRTTPAGLQRFSMTPAWGGTPLEVVLQAQGWNVPADWHVAVNGRLVPPEQRGKPLASYDEVVVFPPMSGGGETEDSGRAYQRRLTDLEERGKALAGATLLETFGARGIGRVFDVGSGRGEWMRLIRRQPWLRPDAAVTGFELEEPMPYKGRAWSVDIAKDWAGLDIVHSPDDPRFPRGETVDLLHEAFIDVDFAGSPEGKARFDGYDRLVAPGGWFVFAHFLRADHFQEWLAAKGYPHRVYRPGQFPTDYPWSAWGRIVAGSGMSMRLIVANKPVQDADALDALRALLRALRERPGALFALARATKRSRGNIQDYMSGVHAPRPGDMPLFLRAARELEETTGPKSAEELATFVDTLRALHRFDGASDELAERLGITPRAVQHYRDRTRVPRAHSFPDYMAAARALLAERRAAAGENSTRLMDGGPLFFLAMGAAALASAWVAPLAGAAALGVSLIFALFVSRPRARRSLSAVWTSLLPRRSAAQNPEQDVAESLVRAMSLLRDGGDRRARGRVVAEILGGVRRRYVATVDGRPAPPLVEILQSLHEGRLGRAFSVALDARGVTTAEAWALAPRALLEGHGRAPLREILRQHDLDASGLIVHVLDPGRAATPQARAVLRRYKAVYAASDQRPALLFVASTAAQERQARAAAAGSETAFVARGPAVSSGDAPRWDPSALNDVLVQWIGARRVGAIGVLLDERLLGDPAAAAAALRALPEGAPLRRAELLLFDALWRSLPPLRMEDLDAVARWAAFIAQQA